MGGKFVIELCHSHTHVPCRKQAPHRLCADVPFSDIKPPVGVDVIGLETVALSIEISRLSNAFDKRDQVTSSRESTNTILGMYDSGNESGFVSLEDGTSCRWHSPQEVDHPPDWCFIRQTRLDEQDWTDEHMLLEEAEPPEDSQLGPHLLEGVAGTEPSAESAADDDKAKSLIELVHSALRMSICDTPINNVSGVTIMSDSLTGRLADIAPALWNPGYFAVGLHQHIPDS